MGPEYFCYLCRDKGCESCIERRIARVHATQAEVGAFLTEMQQANRLPNAMVALLEVGILYPILLEAIAYGRRLADQPVSRPVAAPSRFDTLSLTFGGNGGGMEPGEPEKIDHLERFRKLAVREGKGENGSD